MKDLSAFLTPNLDIKHGSKVYTVKPPTKDVGLKLAAASSLSMAAVSGQTVESLPDSYRRIIDSIKDQDLGELTLGDVYQEMIDDDVPGPHIDFYARYALYYWVYGEQVADEIVSAGKKDAAPKGKARSRSKSGQRSA